MSILIDENTRVIVQGITGREGSFHTQRMLEYGTKVVGGVTPGKGGQKVFGLPVFERVLDAIAQTAANASVIFVPAQFAYQAILEATQNGIKLIVCIAEGIPVQDMLKAVAIVKEKGVKLVGPNCPGIVSVGIGKVGIIPGSILSEGSVGVVSRSGTLTYEIINNLTRAGIGQSSCIGVGGDPILGMRFADILPLFENDPKTSVVVMIGEIGGSDEEEASEFIARMHKPVVGFVSGKTAPPEKIMGHAGAIISGAYGTVESKEIALREAGVCLADHTNEITQLVRNALDADWHK
ncbi:MAG: succinate--CoA ligase subunit alpha [Omnitrophica WOR_2 bacterium RBG_13_44_8b]|nr:MAG: succinate--CoA ligase subunit alpha [Omnitrophica WOR_2 bacterium RBG_13_44_8b]